MFFQIQVQRSDNKPLTKEEREKNVSVKITQSTRALAVRNIMSVSTATFNVSWQNYTLSESGIVSLEFPIPQSFPMIQLEVSTKIYMKESKHLKQHHSLLESI